MKKIIALMVAGSLFAPFVALADSNITASAKGSASISPSGTMTVLTGNTQSFSISGAANVVVDGVNKGSLSSYSFVGDTTDHTITAMSATGGGLLYCSGPMAPGWNVSLPNGGCGEPKPALILPTHIVHNADGSYTLTVL